MPWSDGDCERELSFIGPCHAPSVLCHVHIYTLGQIDGASASGETPVQHMHWPYLALARYGQKKYLSWCYCKAPNIHEVEIFGIFVKVVKS